MAGYIARRGASAGAFDPLYVRTLVLQQKRLRAGIVVADLLLFSSRWAKRLRQRFAERLRIPPENIILAATHTHSGPLVDMHPFDFLGGQGDSRVGKFKSRFEEAALKAIRTAAEQLGPVEVSFARTQVRSVASDRNRPLRNRVQSFLFWRFAGRDSSALLGVYPCHPTVLGPSNRRFSGDLHGEIARGFEREMEAALIANGAAANISTRFTRKSQSRAELSRLAARVLRQCSAAHFHTIQPPRLSVRKGVIAVPLRDLRTPEPRGGKKRGRLGAVAKEARWVREHLRRARAFARGSVIAPITVLGLGDIRLAALPFEIYSDTGEFLWRRSRVVPLCYANGYWGYVPSRHAGRDDYEAVCSPFSAEADEKLRKGLAARVR